MINSKILADCGLFFIAALGYVLITGIAGLTWAGEDEDSKLCSAWFAGCLMYALTVVFMCQG